MATPLTTEGTAAAGGEARGGPGRRLAGKLEGA